MESHFWIFSNDRNGFVFHYHDLFTNVYFVLFGFSWDQEMDQKTGGKKMNFYQCSNCLDFFMPSKLTIAVYIPPFNLGIPKQYVALCPKCLISLTEMEVLEPSETKLPLKTITAAA